jgi:tetratricopeptide (TPR) repeat protein
VASPAAAQGRIPGAPGELDRAWARLAAALEPLDEGDLRQNCEAVRRVAESFDVRRATTASIALVLRARTLPPPQARLLLQCAVTLDPDAPEPRFAQAAVELRRAAVPAAMASLWHGGWALFRDARMKAFVGASLVLATLIAVVGAFLLWAALAVRRVTPLVWHDLIEITGSWRLGRNGVAVALLAIALPIFISLDIVFLGLWVLALGWAYLDRVHRALGLVGFLVAAATPTLIEWGVRGLSFPGDPVSRAAAALAERRWDARVSDELTALTDLLGDQPSFHRLRGDTFRAHGRLEAALSAYREGLRLDPNQGDLLLGQGTVHFLLGEYHAALESFQRARDTNSDRAVVAFNLSLTLAHTYNFRESDEALQQALAADQRRLKALTSGREHQIILPTFTPSEAARLLASKERVLLVNRGLVPPPLVVERSLGHPLTLAGLLALVLAIVHSLLREKGGGLAIACAKCGRAFCRRCRLASESQTYCSQCTNIFLKKDMVAIEVQLAKRRQLARRRIALSLERRFADVLVPGLGLLFHGRQRLGLVLVLVSVATAVLGVVWFPFYMSPALLQIPSWPVTFLAAVVFLAALAVAQLARVETR